LIQRFWHKLVGPPAASKPKPVIHKQAELPRSQPVLTSKPTTLPAPTTFTSTAKKSSPPIHAPATVSKPTASKPVEKTGNGGSDDNNVTSGVVELVQAKPNYPMRAKSRHIEGWVKIAFTVTATGSVTNAHVVGASPPDIFDASALDTIQKFKFKPKMVNGKAVNGEATKTFRFNLR
jgi:protein TonB